MLLGRVRKSVDEARPGCDGAGGGAEEEVAEVGLGGCPGGGGVEEGWMEGEFRGHFFGRTIQICTYLSCLVCRICETV